MKIKRGLDFTLCLTDKGEVYSWGRNDYGQLGIGIVDDNYHNPSRIDFELGIPIRYISVSKFHASAIDFDYNVYMWGCNEYGQLGLGDNMNRSSPTIIECLIDKKIEKIYCVYDFTFSLTQNGEVYTWGDHNDEFRNFEPEKLEFPNNTIIKKLYIGEHHAFMTDTTSKIYSWGCNYDYQICDGDNMYQYFPGIADMLVDFNINKIVCLYSSTIILADNKLYSIGLDNVGELGLGIKETREITLIVDGVENLWGKYDTLFCKMCNGDIYAWGLNYDGQLGIGNKINQNIPIKLNIALDIKSINYCNGVTHAILTSGDIYTWGNNELVSKESITEPTLFTYFADIGIEIKTMNRTKSARKN